MPSSNSSLLGVSVNVSGLDESIQDFIEMIPRIDEAVARALNSIGAQVEDEMARALVLQTSLPDEVVRRQFERWPATVAKPSYNIVATNPMTRTNPDELSGRGIMGGRGREFAVSDLMRVVSQNDGAVCDMCLAVIRDSPYTTRELKRRTRGKWVGSWAHIHPGCRCRIETFRLRRRQEFKVDMPGQGWEIDQKQIEALVNRLRGELELAVSVS